MYAGRLFQSRAVFLRDTCGVTHVRQPAFRVIQAANFDAENTLVFFEVSKFGVHALCSEVRKGKMDVGTEGIASLWSSLDKKSRQSFDAKCLYAYDVNAMQAVLEDAKTRKG